MEGPASDRNSFWKPDKSDQQLEYTLNGVDYKIEGDALPGFVNILERRLNSQVLIHDDEVVKVLRLSNMSDEALGEVWHQASQASYLQTDTEAPNDEDLNDEDSDLMSWKEFLILLDVSYRYSGSDLNSFLARFELPTVRKTRLRNRNNPFQSKVRPESTGLEDTLSQTSLGSSSALSSTAMTENVDSREALARLSTVPDRVHHASGSPPIAPSTGHPKNTRDARRLSERESVTSGTNKHDLEVAKPTTDVANQAIPADLEVLKTFSTSNSDSLTNQSRYEYETGLEVVRPPSEAEATSQDENSSIHPTGSYQPKYEAISSINQPREDSPQPSTTELEVPLCTPETKLIAKNRLEGMQANEVNAEAPSGIKGSMKLLRTFRTKKPEAKFSPAVLAKALEQAAEENSVALAEAFLGFGADPNFKTTGKDPFRHAALQIAAKNNQIHFIDFLILNGADRIAINNALVHSTMAGHVKLSRRLIETHKADVNAWAYLPRSAHVKLPSNVVSRIKYINVLSSASQILNSEDRLEFVQFLVKKGCNINAIQWLVCKEKPRNKKTMFGKDEELVHAFGYSTVGLFVDRVCHDSIQLLLRHGAMLHLSPQKPSKAIMDGFRERNFDCETFSVIQPVSCLTIDCWSSAGDCTKVLDLLIRHGSDVSLDEVNGMWELPHVCSHEGHHTPLTRAVEGDSVEGVKYLIDKRGLSADSVARYSEHTYRKTMLLTLACKVSGIDVVEALLERGAKPGWKALTYSETALKVVTQRGRVDIIELLLKSGADKNDGSITVAVTDLNLEIVQILLTYGASPQSALGGALELAVSKDGDNISTFISIVDAILGAYEERELHIDSDILARAIQKDRTFLLRILRERLNPQFHQVINVAFGKNQKYGAMSPTPSGYWSQTYRYAWTKWDRWNFDRDAGDKINITPYQLALLSNASKETLDLLTSWGADTTLDIKCPRDFTGSSRFKKALEPYTKAGLFLVAPSGLYMKAVN